MDNITLRVFFKNKRTGQVKRRECSLFQALTNGGLQVLLPSALPWALVTEFNGNFTEYCIKLSTSVLDQKGVEIFEDDVCIDDGGNYGWVFFGLGDGCYCIHSETNNIMDRKPLGDYVIRGDNSGRAKLTVIGNLEENPTLYSRILGD